MFTCFIKIIVFCKTYLISLCGISSGGTFVVCILAKDGAVDEAAGQEGGKKKRNRKRNKAKG